MQCHTPLPFDEELLENVSISLPNLQIAVDHLINSRTVSGFNELVWALKALTLTDLTTLAGDDTKANVTRLCQRAAYPIINLDHLVELSLQEEVHTAAVCVYPARVQDAHEALCAMQKDSIIQIAAVATGFPTGQYSLKTRLQEIENAIESGATEIDVVINRSLALEEKWEELYEEIKQMRMVCSDKAHLKTILAIGELGTMDNVYKAAMVAMMAGSDFIKTSTGKEGVNATLPVGLVMIHAIQDFGAKTGRKIGLKPAGGVRTTREAINWMILVKETLGTEWLTPKLFRFGASGLLDDILKTLQVRQ